MRLAICVSLSIKENLQDVENVATMDLLGKPNEIARIYLLSQMEN